MKTKFNKYRFSIMKRYDIINMLIKKHNYKSYLEIGVQNKDNCFNRIDCDFKTCVDPDSNAHADFVTTSDHFFEVHNDNKFDIIFLDGLHHAEQVYKDIINSLACLNENGIIVCHDMNPTTELMQLVPRQSKIWTGDCWRAFVKLRVERDDLRMHVVDTDYGIGLIKKGKQIMLTKDCLDYSYNLFDKYRKDLLNLISVNEFELLN